MSDWLPYCAWTDLRLKLLLRQKIRRIEKTGKKKEGRIGRQKQLEYVKLTYCKPMSSLWSLVAKLVSTADYKYILSIRDIISSPLAIRTLATIDTVEVIVYGTGETGGFRR